MAFFTADHEGHDLLVVLWQSAPFGQNFDAYQECLNSMLEAIPSLVAFLESIRK